MSTIKILDKEFERFIPAADIEIRITELAKKITADLGDKDPLFLIVLNGAFMFASQLVSKLDFPCRLSFLKVSSYKGTCSTGLIDTLIGLQEEIEGQHLVVVDDIIDTGRTMRMIIEKIADQNPASISLASLFLKPESLEINLKADYVGFEIPNKFIVGYGLDYDGYGRNLNDIYVLKQT